MRASHRGPDDISHSRLHDPLPHWFVHPRRLRRGDPEVFPDRVHTHSLPQGLDHILFILGLFFLSRSFPALLFQMTLFTLAHSLTLGLSIYSVVSVPPQVVEVAIALSIAFIAIENLFRDDLSRWRPAVVFCFGLIHGLGFAHSFSENLLVAGKIPSPRCSASTWASSAKPAYSP